MKSSVFLKSLLIAFVSEGIAGIYVAFNHGYGSGDLYAFGFWSLICSILSIPLLLLYQKIILGKSLPISLTVGVIMSGLHAIGWVFLVAALLGPMIGAISFPFFPIWCAGIAAGYFSTIKGRQVVVIPVIVLLLVIEPLALVWVFKATQKEPPPDLMVTLKPGITNEEEMEVWKIFSPPPTETPKGYNPAGISSTGGADSGGLKRLHVTFHGSSILEDRKKLIDSTISSPYIVGVQELADSVGKTVGKRYK